MKQYEIAMSMDRYHANFDPICNWLVRMNIQRAISKDDGYLGQKECDVFHNSDALMVSFFFTNAHLACLFKMRFG
jgi:hypothetical protein